jgi:hypothetical protein
VGGGVQKWPREQDVSPYRQGLENLIACYDKCRNKFGNYVEAVSRDIRVLFLSLLTSIPLREGMREPYFVTFRRVIKIPAGYN